MYWQGGTWVAVFALALGGLGAVAAPVTGSSASHHWETKKALGDAAVSLQIDGPSGTSCGFHVELAGWIPDTAVVERVVVWEWASGESDWFHASWGNDVHAYAGGVVDTRFTMDDLWASTTSFNLPVRSGLTVTLAAPGLEPWPDGFDDGEYSVWIDVECSRAVTASLSGGREVHLLTPRNAQTGVGVGSPLANAGIGNLATGTFTAPDVRMRAGTEGLEAGLLALVGPQGPEAWWLTPGDRRTLSSDGGPGDYTLVLNRVGAVDEDFWAFLAGVWPVQDLDEVAGLPSF